METEPLPKTGTEAKIVADDNMYSRNRYECKECDETFRSKIALTIHSYS